MQEPDSDEPAPDSEKSIEAPLKQVNLRLDPEHHDALLRIAGYEKLTAPAALRKLIRIADQIVSGKKSPFASRLEHLVARKAG
jgi:hypothetical protein